MDYTNISDEELLRRLGANKTNISNHTDYTNISDEELLQRLNSGISEKSNQDKNEKQKIVDFENVGNSYNNFKYNHPFIGSIPEALITGGKAAIKSYPEISKGLNDTIALVGDITGSQSISDLGRSNAQFWQEQADKIKINPEYQGIEGLSHKETFLPTIMTGLGSQASNLIASSAGGLGLAKGAARLGLKGLASAGLATAGTSIPNLVQEGTYLDKIQAFQQMYGRMPTDEEIKQIQKVAIGEKLTNTALETFADKLLFNKMFPQGVTTKKAKDVFRNAVQQTIAEATTEGMQEGVSIGAEKILGINQGDNLARLGDAIAMGGVVGGVLGGAGTLVSRPYNSQIQENAEKAKSEEATKTVSAKIVNGEKEWYNSENDNLNNSANDNNAFDNLRKLSKVGALSGKPNINADGQNAFEAKEQNQTRNNEISEIENKGNVENKIAELAPNIAKRNAETKKIIDDLYDENVSHIEQEPEKYTGERDVSNVLKYLGSKDNKTAVIKTPVEDVTFNENNLKHLLVDNNKERLNDLNKAVRTLQDPNMVVNNVENGKNYNYYIKSFNSENKNKPHLQIVKKCDDGNFYVTNYSARKTKLNKVLNQGNIVYKMSSGRQKTSANNIINDNSENINPNTTANTVKNIEQKTSVESVKKDNADINNTPANNISKNNPESLNTAKTENAVKNTKQATSTESVKQKIAELAPNIAAKNQTRENLIKKAKELGIRGNLKTIKLEKLQAKIQEAETKVEPQKHIYEGWTVQDFIDELEPQVNLIMNGKSIFKQFTNREDLKKWCVKNQPYYKKYVPDVVNYFAKKYNISDENVVSDDHFTTVDYFKKKAESKNANEEKSLNPLDYDYINNAVTGEKIKIQMNEDIAVNEILPQEISSELPFEISKKPSDNKKSLIKSLDINNGKKIEVANENTKEIGVISKATIEKSLSNLTENNSDYSDKIAILNNIQDVFTTSQLIISHNDTKNDTSIKIKRYANIANVEGRNYLLEIVGKNNAELSIYSINPIDTKNGGDQKRLGNSQQLDTANNSISNIRNIFKSKLVEKYNTDYQKAQKNNNNTTDNLYKENVRNSLAKNTETVNNDKKGDDYGQTRRKEISRKSGQADEGTGRSEGLSRNDVANGPSGQRDTLGRRGILKEHEALIDKDYKNQHEKNLSIEKFIKDKEYEKYSELPQEIKDWLKQYSGAGGLEKQGAEGKGLLSEYYTPKNIVKKMWDITAQYIDTDGSRILEPSVGIGRFLEFAPKNSKIDAHEINPVSAKITELLYPNAKVSLGEFQKRFIKNNRPVTKVNPEYDIIIGNPPYGQNSGLYYGMGEGKGIKRLETYFIKRGIDLLNENGVLTYIVPSSFLDSKDTNGIRLAISQKAELLDAYRLPENTFDTTSIGTDIIVFRKNTDKKENRDWIKAGNWFEQHPEKILGEVKTRTNRFGKVEKYVTGDKNVVEKIDTSENDIKEPELVIEQHQEVETPKRKTKKAVNKNKQETDIIKDEEYQSDNSNFSEKEIQTFFDTNVDGSLPEEKYQVSESINRYKGKLYNDFNYLQGDIYEKLEALEQENISEKQKEIQRKKLEAVKPTPKKVEQISISPVSDFAKSFDTGLIEERSYWGNGKWHEKGDKISLSDLYLEYVQDLSLTERDNMPLAYIEKYIHGEKLNFDYNYPANCVTDNDRKKFRTKESIRLKTNLINTVDKTFKNFIKDELNSEVRKNLVHQWNKVNNNIYNPDYLKMPMLVKGLNSTFKNKELKLYSAQVEGVNFLTNKGVGLLGFEVGVGKTLTGIISTVQNMQMGRCKRPLVIVPKQVAKNWVAEINEAFPNIKVNDVGNLSNFKGKIEDNTITVATYQALDNIWYDNETESELVSAISNASINAKKDITKRNSEKTKEQAETVLGKAKAGNKSKFTIQELGFDHITVDEAHNFKNLFAKAQSYDDSNNIYSDIPTGSQSKRACQLFLATQFVLQHNKNRNVFLLTATPFNNNPIEVYNMLSYTAKDILDKMGINNVYQFMETYANVVSDFVVDSNNNVVYKQIVNGFKNVSSLKEIIRSTMLIRTAEEAGVKRPQKHVKTLMLEPTQSQKNALAEAESIAIQNAEDGDVLRAINQSRQATLSPDIANNNFDVSPEDFVNNAPKIKYCCEAISAMLQKDNKTSQILYMPLGVKFLPKIKQYLIDKKVLKNDEIKIVDSSVSDEQIEDIVDSFNDREGKLKLIIGTSKIKEGMNLNKNTSTLYVPYLDWNPTDFQQVVGRLWRQGNSYKNVRVVVPLLKNSSDSFMFQKIQEKSERLNALLSKDDVDFIDMNELNTAEDKINMISAPDKKAKMFIQMEEQKLKDEKASLEGRKQAVKSYKEKLSIAEIDVKSANNAIENIQNDINRYSEFLEKEQNENSADFKRYQAYLDNSKSNLKYQKAELLKAKNKLQSLKNRIKSLEFDFEGKDSEASIDNLIAKKDEEIKNLSEIEKKKFKEYSIQYEKELKESKTIEDYIKEFQLQSEDLYGNDSESFDIGKEVKSFVVKKMLNATYDNLVKKLDEIGFNTPELFSDIISQIDKDYTIGVFSDRNRGKHIGDLKHIYVNADMINNDIYAFTECVFHEIEHSVQHKKYKKLLKKDVKDLTDEESVFILNFSICKLANKNKENFYEENKEVLDEIFKNLSEKNKEEQLEYLNNFPQNYQKVYNKYKELYDEYYNCEFERQAREKGKQAKNKLEGYNERRKISGQRIITDTPFKNSNGNSFAGSGLEKNIIEEKSTNRYEAEDLGLIGLSKINKKDIYDTNKIHKKVNPIKNSLYEKLIVPISTRLDKVNPKIKHAVRRFVQDLSMTENKYSNDVKDFIGKLSRIPESDYAKYDLALKNGNVDLIKRINQKYKLSEDFKKVKSVLNDIRNEALKAGMDVGFIDDYFPRKIINPAKYIDEISKSSFIKKLLKDIDPNNELSDEEKIAKVNSALRGYNDGIKASSSFIKGRKVLEVTPETNAYYKDSKQALVDYITSMNKAIQTRKFFGKDVENIDKSIGAYTKELAENGLISSEDEYEAKEILKSLFNQKGPNKFISNVKNIIYMETMGNPLSTITQIGDFAWSLYENGVFNTIDGMNSALFSKNKIKKEDIGISRIAQEFESDSKTSKLLSRIFKLVGLEQIDTLGKETFINANFKKLQNQAINMKNNPNDKNSVKFYNKLKNIFGDSFYDIAEDLSNNKLSDDVKYLLFNEISNYQPISLAEMPQSYLESGNSRIFYQLRTYSIKQLDVFRNECFRQFKTDPANAIGNLIRLTFYVVALGMTADKAKDFLMGREFDFVDSMLDNVLKLVLYSRYQYQKSKKEGFSKSFGDFFPAIATIDNLYLDVQDEKFYSGEKHLYESRTVKNIPVAGKLYYWWFGGGKEYKNTEIKQKYKKLYKQGNTKEVQNLDKKLQSRIINKYSSQDIKVIHKKTKESLMKEYRKDFLTAIKNNDVTQISKIKKQMAKSGFKGYEISKAFLDSRKKVVKKRLERK